MNIEETHEPLPSFGEKNQMKFNFGLIAYGIKQDYEKIGLFNKQMVQIGEPKVFKLTECLTFEFIEDIDPKTLGEHIKHCFMKLNEKVK